MMQVMNLAVPLKLVEESIIYMQKRLYDDVNKLHHRYRQRNDLTPSERKRMCAGLSGILDTTDDLFQGQISLFDINEWNAITQHYSHLQRPISHTTHGILFTRHYQ
jgi:hypothetical protein